MVVYVNQEIHRWCISLLSHCWKYQHARLKERLNLVHRFRDLVSGWQAVSWQKIMAKQRCLVHSGWELIRETVSEKNRLETHIYIVPKSVCQ